MKLFATLMAALSVTAAPAGVVKVAGFSYAGPFPVAAPFCVDNTDAEGKPLDTQSFSPAPQRLAPAANAVWITPETAPSSQTPAVHVISFAFDNDSYITPQLCIEGIDEYTVYLDGEKHDSHALKLKPATHRIDIRYITQSPDEKPLGVSLDLPEGQNVAFRTDGKHKFSLQDVLHGTRVTSATISPDGKYYIACLTHTAKGGGVTRSWRVVSLSDGRIAAELPYMVDWMPQGSAYYSLKPTVGSRGLVATDAATGKRTTVCTGTDRLPTAISPDCTFAVFTDYSQGRTEDPDIYEILEPEDRQPGWRNRSGLSLTDFSSGVTRKLTFGNRNVSLLGISPDSRRVLAAVSNSRLEKRPTTVFSIIELDLQSMKADTLVCEDGFIGRAVYSPDGSKVLVSGSPEAFGGIGRNLPEGRIPSMQDMQLFCIDRATRKVTSLTADFNPNVDEFVWSAADSRIYFTAEDRDMKNLFRLDPSDGKIQRIALPEEMVKGFSLPHTGRRAVWFGESAASPNALYSLDTKTLKSTLLDSPAAADIADAEFGDVNAWNFVNSRGDTICGRYYLPSDFDPSRKYPVIVNYYGGCSPTSRNFESRYPHHAYTSQGYVVYVVIPGGATGFGQEFSSRHVNTAGQGVAEDIIEGTRAFLEAHPFADASKVGCIGASYGGFMTQYLQTETDLFAAAISHAGISDHTSYWGEGYWGYSYSEVAMAGSYPWSNPGLFVKQSPLYRADKINTPILFLHGDHDNNVPFGESIQMFTALKLLGKPTAFVAVTDQDHQIMDYTKRQKWQDTIFAWFARHLKGDSSWWDALYPPTPL